MGHHRTHILEAADNLINGTRQDQYGDPAVNFLNIAERWSQIVGVQIDAWQVSLMMADLKIARMATTGKPHLDSFIDAAAYVALAAELSEVE